MGFLDKAKQVQADPPKKKSPSQPAAPQPKVSQQQTSQPAPVAEAAPPVPQQATQQTDMDSDSQILSQVTLPQDVVTKELPSLDDPQAPIPKIPLGQPIQTAADKIVTELTQGKRTFAQLATIANISLKRTETLCRMLARQHQVTISYPLIFTQSPNVTLLEDTEEKAIQANLDPNKKQLELYTVVADFVIADVQVWSVPMESTPIYEIVPHKVGRGTRAILSELIDELATKIPISSTDLSDPRKALKLKHQVYKLAKEVILKYFDQEQPNTVNILSGTLLHQSFGLGDLEVLMSDNWLEEIAINSDTEPLSVYHKQYGWLKTTIYYSKDSQIYNLAAQIARRVGKQINSLSPIMDAHLQTGDRVAATLFPISTEGDTLTIRRFSRNPWTVVHMIDEKNKTMSKEVVSFLWLAMQYELNMLIVGGTASGKTSVLNTLVSLIPPTNRIISIEDTREISLPSALHWNWVPLTSKSQNAEGKGEISMLDLMIASLRMRPDRIIVGEIRRKQQAEALFEAMHTGHSVCATMHADTADQVKHRLTQPPIEIPENELQALQLVAVQYRDRRRGVRRTLEVAELLPGGVEEKINLNYLYRWRARGDTFVKDEASIRVVEDLNLHTGMTQKDIQNDLSEKELILDWMLQNRIFDIDKVGHIMRIYYKYPQLLLDTINDKGSEKDLPQDG